jgi:hypothetical protein
MGVSAVIWTCSGFFSSLSLFLCASTFTALSLDVTSFAPSTITFVILSLVSNLRTHPRILELLIPFIVLSFRFELN